MGVDITAYKGLQKCNSVENEDGDFIDENGDVDYDAISFTECESFPGRSSDIDFSAVYHCEDAEDIVRLGYGGYNRFRNWLAQIAGYPLTKYADYAGPREGYDAGAWKVSSGPFWELINFSDCEGTLGTSVCTKLAKDFSEFHDKAMAAPEAIYHSIYRDFRKGFELAAQGGAVRFS